MILRPLFATVVAVLVALAWQARHPVNAAVLAGCALGLVGVAINYLRARPGASGKRRDGRMAPWAFPINWLNFALLQASFRLWRRLNREDPWNRVDDHHPVYVGRRLLEPDRAAFEAAEARWAVLDLTSEFGAPALLREQEAWLCLAVLDGFPPSPAQLEESARWIAEQLAEGRAVYVHCAVGHGRSAMAAAAWMLRAGHATTADEAVAALTQRRRWVSLTGWQRDALVAFAAPRDGG